jgi:cytochrome c
MTKRPVVLPAAALFMAASWMMTGSALAAEVSGNPANGKAVFQRTCANCHSTEIGVNKIGPSLWGIVDRPIAVVPDYTYSETLRQRKTEWQTWDEAALNVYLRNPREAVHGVKMFFKGLPAQSDRLDVISYLQTLK